ncbi:hypothetical protein C5167_028381 [Papaver somniferum]|nr:hypothetical protein C5167_028381 [Papaver somniferum]
MVPTAIRIKAGPMAWHLHLQLQTVRSNERPKYKRNECVLAQTLTNIEASRYVYCVMTPTPPLSFILVQSSQILSTLLLLKLTTNYTESICHNDLSSQTNNFEYLNQCLMDGYVALKIKLKTCDLPTSHHNI